MNLFDAVCSVCWPRDKAGNQTKAANIVAAGVDEQDVDTDSIFSQASGSS